METSFRDDVSMAVMTGTVIAAVEGIAKVETPDCVYEARPALSCLLAPEEGDLVLMAIAAEPYVIAILERPESHEARIAIEGNCAIELRTGRLRIAASEGVDLVSRQAVSLTSDRIEARARQTSLLLGSVKLIAGAVDATLDRIAESVKRVFRRVEEIEHVRAGQIDYASDGNLRLHGENALLTARELIKADGKQIHIG